MSEFLAAAAKNMGLPEALVMRSAEAKAKAQGVTVEDLLREWAGGEAAAPTSAPAPTPAAPVPAESAPAPVAPTVETPVAETPVEVVHTTLPTPDTVTPAEAMGWDQVTTIGSDDVRERPGAVIPRWLAAVFVIVPVLALAYLFLNTDGLACGESGQLAVSFDGQLANCDLSAYAPGGGSGGAALAAAFSEGQGLYAQCSACHGASGEGGVGPAFGNVTATFGSCSDHVRWVQLGSAGWPDATYGDTATPVAGGMPGFGGTNTEEALTALSLYERVQFGGQPLEEAGVDCGLVEVAGEPVEGEAPTEDA